jgi:hypothetical protein
MSYNNYGNYPYGSPYQSPYYHPNVSQNNQVNQQPQMNQYAFVNGIEGAKSFQLNPNQTILLMDSDSPVCYMKTSNGVGQSTLRYFKLTEVTEADLKAQSIPNDKSTEYVTKNEFKELSNRFEELLEKINKKEE